MESVKTVLFSLAIPVYLTPEEVNVGKGVFYNFVHEEFIQEEVSDELFAQEEDIVNDFVSENNAAAAHGSVMNGDAVHTPEGYKSVVVSQIGTNIRQLAREFEKSRERQLIKREADEVDLGAINSDTFWGLLDEVFKHDINPYNLVALFYFCSDVLIRCVKRRLKELGMNLFRWALQYIAEKVCQWVHDRGGWEKVCTRLFPFSATLKIVAVVAVVFGVGWLGVKALKN